MKQKMVIQMRDDDNSGENSDSDASGETPSFQGERIERGATSDSSDSESE